MKHRHLFLLLIALIAHSSNAMKPESADPEKVKYSAGYFSRLLAKLTSKPVIPEEKDVKPLDHYVGDFLNNALTHTETHMSWYGIKTHHPTDPKKEPYYYWQDKFRGLLCPISKDLASTYNELLETKKSYLIFNLRDLIKKDTMTALFLMDTHLARMQEIKQKEIDVARKVPFRARKSYYDWIKDRRDYHDKKHPKKIKRNPANPKKKRPYGAC